MKLDLMYYYGNTAEQYSFYRIPKALFTDAHFQGVSMEAKLLYGLMLDRMGLSVRNGWLDSDGKVYIFFTLEDALTMLGYGKDKAVRLFKELDDIGLIERRKQGQGRPTRIYVKNFILPAGSGEGTPVPAAEEPLPQTSEKPKSALRDTPEVLTSEKPKSALRYIPAVLSSEIPKSGLLETRSLDFGKTDTNKTDKNKTEMSDTEPPSTPLPPTAARRRSGTDRRGRLEAYRAIIRENIDCDILLRDCGCDPGLVNGCVELMAEVCASSRETIRVNQEELPAEQVRSRFLKLDMTHIAYALDVLTHAAAPVGNVRGYTVRRVGNRYHTTKEMDSIRIKDRQTWKRYSNGKGGDAITFLQEFCGKGFREAVDYLLEFNGGRARDSPVLSPRAPPLPEERPEFVLPPANGDNRRVFAYLRKRGIAPQVIRAFLDSGLLYEDEKYHNCVFVGRDGSGQPKFACKRGTYDKDGVSYKRDVLGSDKNVAFSLPCDPTVPWVLVFEAPIDLMSFCTLHREVQSNAVALCGLSSGALDTYLRDNPNLRHVVLCLDADGPGQEAVKRLTAEYEGRGLKVSTRVPPKGKDWNEYLQQRGPPRERERC